MVTYSCLECLDSLDMDIMIHCDIVGIHHRCHLSITEGYGNDLEVRGQTGPGGSIRWPKVKENLPGGSLKYHFGYQ